MGLKESIQKLEEDLRLAKENKVENFYIGKITKQLDSLYRKRDLIFARHNARKHDRILLRDIPVKLKDIPQWKREHKKAVREAKKKTYKNIYIEDHNNDKTI